MSKKGQARVATKQPKHQTGNLVETEIEAMIIWDFFYYVIHQYFMYAPKQVFGYENMLPIDICAKNYDMSIASLNSQSGMEMCEQKIHDTLVGRTTLLIFFLAGVVGSYLPSIIKEILNLWRSLYHRRNALGSYEEKRKKQHDTQMKQKETKEKNSSMEMCLSNIALTLKSNQCDYMILEQIKIALHQCLSPRAKEDIKLETNIQPSPSIQLLHNNSSPEGFLIERRTRKRSLIY